MISAKDEQNFSFPTTGHKCLLCDSRKIAGLLVLMRIVLGNVSQRLLKLKHRGKFMLAGIAAKAVAQ